MSKLRKHQETGKEELEELEEEVREVGGVRAGTRWESAVQPRSKVRRGCGAAPTFFSWCQGKIERTL